MRGGMDDRALVERQLGRRPRAFRRVAVRCPFGAPAVTEQAPYDDARRPVPDDVLPHVPAPRRGRRRGSRRRAAWSAGAPRSSDDPASPPTSSARPTSSAAPPRARGGPNGARTTARRSSSASAAARNPRRLKCLHAHVAYALASPGYLLGERVLAELEPLWPQRALLHRPVTLGSAPCGSLRQAEVESARREWEDGHRRLLAEATRPCRGEPLHAQVDAVLRGAAPPRRRHVHARASSRARTRGAERWSREAVAEHAPAPGWPRTLSLVEAAAFHLYARGA